VVSLVRRRGTADDGWFVEVADLLSQAGRTEIAAIRDAFGGHACEES